MSAHKFECGKCGQRLSATTDEIGLVANCPSCGADLVIPPPKPEPKPASADEKPARRISLKLSAALAATKAFGLTYRKPEWAEGKSDEELATAIDKFFEEIYHLTDLLHEMEIAGQIARLPDAEELQTVRVLLFEAFLREQWSGTQEKLKSFIFQGAPDIRPA
jgi:hypothetical protein